MNHIVLIAHLADLTGAQLTLIDIANALRSEFDVEIICPAEGPFTERLSQAGIPWAVIRQPIVALSEQARMFRKIALAQARLGYIQRVRRYLLKSRPRLVLVNSLMNFYGGLAARAAGMRTVFFVHEILPRSVLNRFKAGIVERTAQAIFAPAIANATMFTPQSQREKFKVIPLAVDLQRFKSNTENRVRGREQLGLSEGEFAIGTICHITPRKGVQDFLTAAEYLAKRASRCRFFVVGRPDRFAAEYYKGLVEFVNQRNLSGIVRFIDHTDSVENILAALDLFTLASMSESSPRVILEAMAASTPVLATRVGGIPELLDNGAGVLVPPRQPLELAKGMLELMNDAGRRKRMVEKARRRVEDSHSPEVFQSRILKAINDEMPPV